MKRVQIAALLFVVSMFSITCKKEHLPSPTTNGTPVFYFNGIMNGSPISINAGVNNYYMYSSYIQDSNNVYNFIGNLKQVSSANNSITFIINDDTTTATGGTSMISKSVIPGYYNFISTSGGTPTQYSTNFNSSLGSAPVASYTYTFGDGNTISGSGAPPINYPYTYTHPGNYATSLSVLFVGGVKNSLSNQLKFTSTTSPLSDKISRSDSGSSPFVAFICSAFGGSGYTYVWNFDDTSSTANTASGASVSHTFSDTSRSHNVSVMVTDAASDTIVTYTNAGSSAYNRQYLVNYNVLAPTLLPNPNSFSNVKIIYTDATGTSYSSADSTAQRPGSNFQIISVTGYQNNENNQTTKMLHVKFNCTLYNGSNSITINNGDAVIAVAYK